MIELLGQSALNSIITAGRGAFVSLFRKEPSDFGESSGQYPRSYTSTRGILINKEFVENTVSPDLTKGYQFQFNPQTISDVKNTLYETRQYAGLPYNDYIWGGGGERIISFQLFMDNTPQSKQREFRPTAYGSKLAKQFETTGEGYTYNENGTYTLDPHRAFQELGDEFRSIGRTLKDRFNPSKGPHSFKLVGDAATNSRVDERGILPEVELLQSFLYPAPLVGEGTPLFAEGGIVDVQQFRPPPTVILAIGPIYLEGVIKSAPINYTLFDQDLTPIRATVDIEFAVFEFEEIERRIERRF